MDFGKKQGESVSRSLVKGILTGVMDLAVCHPTEFVKTQLQLQSKSKIEYKGIIDCGLKTVKSHGPMGLYRGAAPLIFVSSFRQVTRWTSYISVANQLQNACPIIKDEPGEVNLPFRIFAGFWAGFFEATLAATPMETIKTRVVDDIRRGAGNYKGSVDACVKIIRREGPLGLYRGVIPTIAKTGMHQMVRFPAQHAIVCAWVGGDAEKRESPIYNGIAGAGAGALSVILTMPADTVKTRMQSEEAKKLYKGTLDCAKQIVQKEGVAFFFAGTWPRMIRVSLEVGMSFTVFPLLSKYI